MMKPRRMAAVPAGTIAVAGLFLAACSSGGGSSPAAGPSITASSAPVAPTVTVAGLRISGGYVPQPASPDVASAYLTITNTTGTAQQLRRVVTDVTGSVMAMDESEANGVGSMTDLSRVDIAAHGTYRFVPNHAHLMLEHPTRLVAGDRVRMTLTFSAAGTVRITLPVIPITSAPQPVPSSYSERGSSSAPDTDMPGMSMSG